MKKVLFAVLLAVAYYYTQLFGVIVFFAGLCAVITAEVILNGLRLGTNQKYGYMLFLIILGFTSSILDLLTVSNAIMSAFFIVLAVSVIGDLIYEK